MMMENRLIPAVMVILLTVVCAMVVVVGLRNTLSRTTLPHEKQSKILIRTAGIIFLWISVIGFLAYLGFFKDLTTLPPRPVFIFVLAVIVAVFIAFSKSFAQMLLATPPHWLIYIQSFRIFVELILWQAWMRELLPVQMTFEGYNFDMVSGLLAIPAGWLISKNPTSARKVGILYNVIGLLLLFNILTIAVLSMPTPLRYFMNEPSNIIVGEFPFIYIPAVFVVLAIFMHIFSLRQIALLKKIDQ
jgi:hypothetical protein